MANKHEDWVPHRESDFVKLCKHWLVGLSDASKATAYGWKQEDLTPVRQKLLEYITAQEAYEADDSSKNRLAKNEAKAAAEAVIRDFANIGIRYNKKMPDEDRLAYGISPPDTTHTPTPAPHTYPEAEADTSVLRQITINFWDSATKKRAKPQGVHGAEIRWAMLDHQPASISELVHSDFDTSAPFTLTFDESDRGGRVYFTLRWETHTNQKGPFSEIYSANVP